jgi:hypothetical protein
MVVRARQIQRQRRCRPGQRLPRSASPLLVICRYIHAERGRHFADPFGEGVAAKTIGLRALVPGAGVDLFARSRRPGAVRSPSR